MENLALACVSCSLRKGARVTAQDPSTRVIAPLFNPRTQRWADHFSLMRAPKVIGKTAVGRATVLALAMNRPAVVAIRLAHMALGRLHPA